MVTAIASEPERDAVEHFVREIPVLPEMAKADDVLLEMQRRSIEHVLVIDEYGGTAGIVALDALTRRIVGAAPSHTRVDDKGRPADSPMILDGLLPLPDVNDRLGLHLDAHASNTLGGYVMGRLGRAAVVEDEVFIDGFVMKVASVDGLRITTVEIRRR